MLGDSQKSVFGAAFAGFLELLLFHPIDTAARWSEGVFNVVFGNATQSNGKKLASLYNGFGFAVVYKVLQRSLQFGIHPIINRKISQKYSQHWTNLFGRYDRIMISGCSGVIVGLVEVILLPLDALKVKGQTGVKIYSERNASLASILNKSPTLLRNLYAGASWTAARNSIGLFALFGSSTFVKEVLSENSQKKVPVWHLFLSSLVGAISSILVAAPFDVIKVRMQATSLNSKRVKGRFILLQLLKTEGIVALAKGIAPKLLASAPKVTFTFTVSQWISSFLN